MAELSEAALKLLAAQRQRYRSSLPEKAAHLREVRGQPFELQDAVHKIAGSAGLHGLDGIQQQAATVEQSIKSAQTAAEIDEMLEDLLLLMDSTPP